jgi:hypothetical protein
VYSTSEKRAIEVGIYAIEEWFMWKTIAILGLALSIGVGTAYAQGKQHKRQGQSQKPNIEQIFKAKDTDHDGKLSKDEFVGKVKDPERVKALEARFKAADTDGDGSLTLDEFKAAWAKSHVAGKQHGKKTPPHTKSTTVT